MKVKKIDAGEYLVTLDDGRKFAVDKDGYSQYPWNIKIWNEKHQMGDVCEPLYGCYETKREAIEQLKFEENEKSIYAI